MSNFDSGGGSEDPWEDRGELAWSEFDWERYLRDQEESVRRFLSLYEAARHRADRIDWVADKMGWDTAEWSDGEEEASDSEEAAGDSEEPEPSPAAGETDAVYTVHRDPVYIATKAIVLSLVASWRKLAREPDRVPSALALGLLASLHRAEECAVEAVHALDFGDFALAATFLKRALAALNEALALLGADEALRHRHVAAWREGALPRCFDLREIWLRVIAECRHALEHPVEDEGEQG